MGERELTESGGPQAARAAALGPGSGHIGLAWLAWLAWLACYPGRMSWTLTDAKNKLSKVLDLADAEGPQVITRRGREYAVVPGEAYRKLTGDTPSFFDLLIGEGPRFGDDLQPPPRTQRPLRKLEL